MAMFYFNGYSQNYNIPNFGDDINPQLLSYFFSKKLLNDPHQCLIGVGSILNDDYFKQVQHYEQRIVFTSGAGYGTISAPPRTGWHYPCVRGPKTAHLLGLHPESAICDGAILLAEMWRDLRHRPLRAVGFVPHIASHIDAGGTLQNLVEQLGYEYIPPSLEGRAFVDAVCSVECVITESLHGAIVADTFRVPWIAVDLVGVNPFKWQDWCESVDLTYNPVHLMYKVWDVPTLELPPPSPVRVAGRWAKRTLLRQQLKRCLNTRQPTLSAPGLVGQRMNKLLAKVDWINESFG